jgi:hypothetical protein
LPIQAMLSRCSSRVVWSRMRRYRAFLGGVIVLATLCAAAEPSSAEGFLRRLFGFIARAPEYVPDRGPEPGDDYGRGDAFPDSQPWPEDMSTYRTLCVRLCDGFYFPMSEGVRRERLHPDANACTQRCDGEVRLFYYPTRGGSPETMVDLAGHTYSSLPNAFLYRKKLVDGCTCKPPPWSPQEAARHQGYAAEAAQQKAAAAAGGASRTAEAPETANPDEPPPARGYPRRTYNYSPWPPMPPGHARNGWR